MKHSDKSIDDILLDYCSGTISDKDLMVLHSWMEKSEVNRKEANKYLNLYRSYKAYHAIDEMNTEKAYNNLKDRVHEVKRRRRFNFLRSAAAILVLLLGSVFIFNWLSNQKQVLVRPEVAQVIEAGKAKATLILDNGSQISLEGIGDSIIQLEEGTSIQKNLETIDYRNSSAEKEVLNTIRIPRGGEYKLVLSDGTKIWLNSDSELTYPVKFFGATREVVLQGEAYMEVAENKEVPFIVHAQGTSVKVLGTAFNVKAYNDEKKVETTLVKGQVAFYRDNQEQDGALLMPGKQAVADANSRSITVREVDTHLYTSWKDGLFVFENLTLPEIFTTLGRWYDVRSEFDNQKLKNLHFTGDLERYANINTHLEMIELTTNVKFEISGNTVYIKNKK